MCLPRSKWLATWRSTSPERVLWSSRADHLTPSNTAMFDEIAAFLTGEHLVVEVDRILTTVLFTDIVGSTAHAASLGDQQWRALLDMHDRTVRDQLRRFRGTEINTTGDGFVASFDGPARAIRCAQAIVEATSKLGIELRIGLHTGNARGPRQRSRRIGRPCCCPRRSAGGSRRDPRFWRGHRTRRRFRGRVHRAR